MAKSNRRRIDEALQLIASGLKPFLSERLSQQYGDDWVEQAARNSGRKYDRADVQVNEDDPAFLFSVIIGHWQNIFRKTLGNVERGYVGELQAARNRWAHSESFTLEEVARVLDTGYLLLSAVAAEETGALDELRQETHRLRYEERTKKETRTPLTGLGDAGLVEGLRPWREVIAPHDDVASGRYQQAEFAADLAQVHRGNALPEYSDPVEFFKRTYITRGLQDLLTQVMRRISGQGGEPVIDLLTTFGGGKTHSLLSVYHLCSPGVDALSLPNVDEVAVAAGVESFPENVNRAVLVGTALSPNRITDKPDGVSVRTLWGELAWQLGGAEAYEMVRPEDEGRVDPGSDVLEQLFSTYGPCVILIDEWVAYARQLWDREDLAGGSFDTQMSFAQSLTEAVRAVPTAMLLVSLPASDGQDSDSQEDAGIEVGGIGGVESLKRLRNVIKRSETPWQPASAEESFEIVRRRLFKPLDAEAYAQRDATARRFHQMYVQGTNDFPSETRQPDYEARIKNAYPIHPEFFDRLYQDWASLERFQRTRGVLRLMAAVVHALWDQNDQRPLIMPGSIPLDDRAVREEFTHHLEAHWASVIDADIDGVSSVATSLDREVQSLGRVHAARRVSRTIFLGSAPSERQAGGSDRVRGVEDVRIKLGTVLPGESPATFGDALRRMSERASYLFQMQSRYWFGTSPSIQRKAQDQADAYASDYITEKLIELVRAENDLSIFRRVHRVPSSSTEVPDEAKVGLVIIGPQHPHLRKSAGTDSAAVVAARNIVEKRGTLDRQYRNMLVFLAADEQQLPYLEDALRQQLAWQSILDQKNDLDLTTSGIRQAEDRLRQATDTVSQRLNETYAWLVYPQASPQEPVTYAVNKINGSGSLAERAAAKARSNDIVLGSFGPTALRTQLDSVPLWQGDHLAVSQLWEYFASHPYLPRLVDESVLLNAVASGPNSIDVERDGFGYAEAVSSSGEYLGVVIHQVVPAPTMTGSVIVKPSVALKLAEASRQQGGSTPDAGASSGAEETDAGQAGSGKSPALPNGLSARVEIDPARAVKGMEPIAREILVPLLALQDSDVSVTLRIEANTPGIDRDVLNVLVENLKTLGFDIELT